MRLGAAQRRLAAVQAAAANAPVPLTRNFMRRRLQAFGSIGRSRTAMQWHRAPPARRNFGYGYS
jgi:hypothetical protein